MRYTTLTHVYDAGPFVDKLILTLPFEIEAQPLKTSTFQVLVQLEAPYPTLPGAPEIIQSLPTEGERKVKAAYVSNAKGVAAPKGSHVTLDLEVGPTNPLGSLVRFNGRHNHFLKHHYHIVQNELLPAQPVAELLVFDEDGGNQIVLGDDFKEGEVTEAAAPLRYTAFTPPCVGDTTETGTVPLIIWLHGGGEGGEETLIAAVANKVVNLASDQVQQYFDGAYVLVPQCPTFWMDDGSGKWAIRQGSCYEANLKALIDDYVAAHPAIDTQRIYLGGCSNGGYMVMHLLIQYPDYFAAAFPVCEAYPDEAITEADCLNLAQIPIWFTHAKNDPIIPFEEVVWPTYKRLMAHQVSKTYCSFLDEVCDASGQFTNEDGTPYTYNGHWSWIYALNNQIGRAHV